jgi:Alternative complex III, ActD subunit
VTSLLLAKFSDSSRFIDAARRARGAHYRLVDAFTPFPVEGINELLEHRASRIRLTMFIGGIVTALFMYGLEYFSAAINYPYNSGGRPLNAWPTFMLVPFATGILVSAVVGFATFLIECGLPRLYEPLFAVEGFERASQDEFVLAIARPDGEEDKRRAIDFLRGVGARVIREVEPKEP